MNSMLGADPEELRDLARCALKSSEHLAKATQLVSGTLGQAKWLGPDAQRFKARWGSQLRPLLMTVGKDLQEVSSLLKQNAEEQLRASAADGGITNISGSGGPGGGDGQGRDLPGNPEADDGMGEYHDLPDHIPLDNKALDPSNMEQGQLGDCWFLAAAGAVAKHDPDWIREHMKQNADGTWTVTMYKNGKPVEITVEASVPDGAVTDASGRDNWLAIYEKAAAEYFGGDYKDLDGGFSDNGLAAITGKDTDRSGQSDFNEIDRKLQDGPVAVGTETKPDDSFRWFWEDEQIDDNRIVPDHAYIVDSIETRENPDTGDRERMIHLINPWGPNGGEYDGEKRWGDIWLTEDQYKENFDSVYSSKTTKD